VNINQSNLLQRKNLRFVKWGIFWCVAAGLTYGFGSTFQTLAYEYEPFVTLGSVSLLMLPLLIASMQDLISAVLVLIKNIQTGKQREYLRSFVSKPARYIVLGSAFGGPIALGTYCTAIYFAGPVYPVAITAILPAAGAVLARIVLKEKISPRGWFGILLCVVGPLLITWQASPDLSAYPLFYVGIILSVITAFGWAGEVVVSTAGMDFIDPEVAIGIRFFISGALSFVAMVILGALPLGGMPGINPLRSIIEFGASIPTSAVAMLIPAAIFCGYSYFFYYKGANMAGAARAAAINPLFVVSATVLGIFVWKTPLTWLFFVGLAIQLLGATLVIGKPRDLFSLRDTTQDNSVQV
jgi:drug/metabolite transporter (DMT)-like permease